MVRPCTLLCCNAHGISKRVTILSTNCVSIDSIKSLLHMDLDCIVVDKNGNTAGPVRLGTVSLVNSRNYNLFTLSKLLRRLKVHVNALKVVMTNRLKVLILDIVIKLQKMCYSARVLNVAARLSPPLMLSLQS